MLADGLRDPYHVRFLKGVGTQQKSRHLAGDGNDGDAVHQRRGQASDQIRGGRPARHDTDAHPARRPRIPVGHVAGGLLVAYKHMVNSPGGLIR